MRITPGAPTSAPAFVARELSAGRVDHPPVLLTVADAYGTLAAVRSLGRAGVPVAIADPTRFTPALWSRYATRTLRCPEMGAAPDAFLAWLLAEGRRRPGQVLLATSDDAVWMYARHRGLLARDFRLRVPSLEAIHGLLDKWRLHQVCRELGIDTPETWLPRSEAELEDVGRQAPFPVVIKPRTQAFLTPHQKGRIVCERAELVGLCRELRTRTRHAAMLLEYDPEVGLPVVQAFSPSGADRIYDLAGFVDETGDLFIVEASRKVLQWPLHLGVGLCFEEAEVVPELARDVARLCRKVGYYGPFEVEFVESAGRHQLIDFNPRFYGQMAFEVARGLDLPRFTYLMALEARDSLRDEIERLRQERAAHSESAPAHAYCNRLEMEVVLGLLAMAGSLPAGEWHRWHRWAAQQTHLTDPLMAADDPGPAAVASATALLRRAAHPRSNWRAARASAPQARVSP